MRIIKKISLNHDEKVLTWRDELFHLFEKPSQSNSTFSSNSQNVLANLDYTEPHSDPDSDSDSFKKAYDTDESDITAPSFSIITNTGDLSNQELSGSELGNLSDAEHSDGDDESNMSLQLVNYFYGILFIVKHVRIWDIVMWSLF